ncbi:MAG TPA: tetratricopeptide repeat protein [Rhodopila sp.]|uniref:tetratricopeptide repeat protein n=1 Tax=Rhodopila sp. TaxID=2480087 RepID=UPI002C33E30A|nr:tetratricopeptide repeat protein [Rhodopila sp.]HVY14670.1 tetratricopeptide repeat protein [Rhodopila sp.]
MRRPSSIAGAVLGVFLLLGSPVAAQPASGTKADIDALLNALKTAPNEETAALLEDRLQRLWLRSGSAVATLLMNRGLRSVKAEQYDDAITCFTDAITLKPDYAEAFRQRALARYKTGDTPGAVADLGEAVKLEPRDFLAYHAMADIAQARNDWKAAYLAWQKVLEIDPKTEGADERLRELKVKAVGEDL